MGSTVAALRARVDPSPVTAGMAVGDVVLIATFVALGELQHGYNPAIQPLRFLATLVPFLLGWVLVAPPVGAYGRRARRTVRGAVATVGAAWISAALVGQALRATPLFHGDLAPAFVVVSIAVGLVLLAPWRAAVVSLTSA